MIARLRGRLAERLADAVILDVAGVGYRVMVAAFDEIPLRGETVELHTSLQVREDSMTLYGFADRQSLEVFELLLTSSGIGPRTALAALGTHRADALCTAIANGDTATLTAVPGIGRKSADRLVLELQDKLAAGPDVMTVDGMSSPHASTPLGEVQEALRSLGYLAGEVQAAVAGLDAQDGSTSELLRRALQSLGTTHTGGG